MSRRLATSSVLFGHFLGRRPVNRRAIIGAASCGAGVLGWPVGGMVAAVLAGVCAGVFAAGWVSTRQRRAAVSGRDAELELLAAVAGELRAGRHPADAFTGVAAPPGSALDDAVRAARATAALGGDVSASLRGNTTGLALPKLAAAWQVSEHCGAPLADAVAQVAADVRASIDLERDVDVELTGARATGVVLAVLPALGVALGTAMGAHPIQVLLHSSAGGVCVLSGMAFELAGLAWVRRLINGSRRCAV